MKYKDFSDEIITDERDFRNYKVSIVIGLIAATWAFKPATEKLDIVFMLSLMTSVVFLCVETIRIFLGIEHGYAKLDQSFREYKANGSLGNLDDWQITASLQSTWKGEFSKNLHYLNLLILITNVVLFLVGATRNL